MNSIDTDEYSTRLREKAIDVATNRILISRIGDSAQEDDLTEPSNCGGLGRIRHFVRSTVDGWPDNPLPIDPALQRLGLPGQDSIEAQVFQNAACNWRCWYCFVPFSLLSANESRSQWVSSDELVDMYASLPNRPRMIDCSGGQPDLVPEWVPWMMQSLINAGLADSTYLWSDDNLSNDYFWRYLDDSQLDLIRQYRSYGRVCCFKGYDETSFAFNTKADPSLFQRQFELFGRLLSLGIDLYAYVTFTTPTLVDIEGRMERFLDRLMSLHPNLPLRTVPLRIENYGVVSSRVGLVEQRALIDQDAAIVEWNRIVHERFSEKQRSLPVTEINLHAE
ncbi:hypothetical protein [Kribbella sindirgiensis]|uniref:Radical SAM protein n=1 Tax=Kribbella sindirgiensis TaxID=1124744 RepID=A0A4R0JCL4_9ACTN|nr:hypothetical protein [Kribbella sindirgiensis]TCC39365.1 hypothetical protein E0H50_05355 [Kribbella sindirgiensis]